MFCDYDLTIRRVPYKKRLHLHCDLSEGFVLTCPVTCTSGDIQRFLSVSRRWMEKENQKRKDKVQFFLNRFSKSPLHLNPIPLLGKEILLPKHFFKTFEDLNQFYFSQAKKNLPERVLKIKSQFLEIRDFSVQVRISKGMGNWGSLNAKNTLSLNHRLLQAPPEILDHVIKHELCHLVHRNHSPEFWSLLKDMDRNTTTHNAWLKSLGWTLQCVDYFRNVETKIN